MNFCKLRLNQMISVYHFFFSKYVCHQEIGLEYHFAIPKVDRLVNIRVVKVKSYLSVVGSAF